MKGVSHVFNYDVPWHPDDYVHRIGRTGRAGATGIAYTLATPDDAEAVVNIEKLTGTKIPRLGGGAPEKAGAAPEPEEQAPVPRASRSRPRAEERPPRPRREPPRPREERAPQHAEREQALPTGEGLAEPKASDADAEWNGPIPSFLGAGFTG